MKSTVNSYPQPMQSVWQSLLWKEWQELKWKLVALTVFPLLLLLIFIVGIEYTEEYIGLRYINDTINSSMNSVLMSYCVLAGAFLGMHVAGREKQPEYVELFAIIASIRSKSGIGETWNGNCGSNNSALIIGSGLALLSVLCQSVVVGNGILPR